MKWLWLHAFALVVFGSGCTTTNPTAQARQDQKSQVQKSIDEANASLARSQQPEVDDEIEQIGFTPKRQSSILDGQDASRVRATVDGVAILDDELKQAAFGELMEIRNLTEPELSVRTRQILRRELEKLIERELIMKEAHERMAKRGHAWDKLQEYATKEFDKQMSSYRKRLASKGINCETDEQFKEVLASQGMSVEALQRQSERQFLTMEYMRNRIFPQIERLGHQQIRDYYDQHPGEFQIDDRVKWQDIFINSAKHPNREAARRFAEEIARAAQNGDDFVRLCQQYDDGDSAGRKGDGYGQKRGEIRPLEVEEHLFAMREGETGPIVEMATGFHVIRLVEREHAGMQPFDEKAQALIKKKLQGIIMEREYKRIVNEMKRRAVIHVLDTEP